MNNKQIDAIINNINTIIVGKQDTIKLLVLSLLCEGHVLIEDVPGTGKTTLALALAKSIDGSFNRVSCTPDLMPSDLTGFSIYNPKDEQFEYQKGAIFSNIFLMDEINRATPKTQAGLLEVMEENNVTVDNITHTLPSPFMVVATQNPVESYGTYPLPEAQLDRFLMKLSLGYPTLQEEIQVIDQPFLKDTLTALSPVITANELTTIQRAIQEVHISDNVKQYIVSLVDNTRNSNQVRLGISTRGTLALARAAKALAYYNNRDFVLPDDVQTLFLPVCSHRLLLKPEAEFEHVTAPSLLNNILKIVSVIG